MISDKRDVSEHVIELGWDSSRESLERLFAARIGEPFVEWTAAAVQVVHVRRKYPEFGIQENLEHDPRLLLLRILRSSGSDGIRIIDLLEDRFGTGPDVCLWLMTRMRELNNRTPRELIYGGESALVLQLLESQTVSA